MPEYVRVARDAGRRVSNIYFNNTDTISTVSLGLAGGGTFALLFGVNDVEEMIGALMIAAGYRIYRLQEQRYN